MSDTPQSVKAVKASLHDEIQDVADRVDEADARNQEDHKAIMEQIVELVSDKKALRLVGILVGIALGSIAGTITYFATKLDGVKQSSEHHEAEGMEIGRGLRRDVERIEEDVEELQGLHRLKPGRDE